MALLPVLAAMTMSALSEEPASLSPSDTSPPLLTAEGTRWGSDGKPVVEHPLLGVAVDVGFPDGVAAGFLAMPVSFLRIHLVGLTNGLSSGARIGATLMAFPTWPVRPTLEVDGGYAFGGQGGWLLSYLGDETLRTALSKVTVAFASAHLGLELGSRYVALTIQGGVSWVDISLGTQAFDLGHGVTLQAVGSSLRGFVPSVRLGFIVCFG